MSTVILDGSAVALGNSDGSENDEVSLCLAGVCLSVSPLPWLEFSL